MGNAIIKLGHMEGKSSTFKFPWSRARVHLEPNFIPKDKQTAEMMLTMYFCQMHMLHMGKKVTGIKANENDSNKNADTFITADGKDISIQITRLMFTNYETRKAIAKRKSLEFAKAISGRVNLLHEVVITIFPKQKHKIPLKNLGSRAKTLEKKLLDLIVLSVNMNIEKLVPDSGNVDVLIKDGELREHFYSIDICPVPKGMYANVYGLNNIFINYNFNGSTYNDSDSDKAIDELFKRKDRGVADLLLIWANSFELHGLEKIVQKLWDRFGDSTFQNVQFMTFYDNVAFFRETLQLWGIKPVAQVVK
jgi:hypothetical protein